MNDESDCIIRNKQQIIKHLDLLIKQKVLCSLYFGDNASFITTLLDTDPLHDRILLDSGPKDYLNKCLFNSTTIRIRADVSGIKVAFEGSNIKPATYQGQTAFSMPIPKELLWRQRRQFYRVKSPLSKASFLKLVIDSSEPTHLQLYDLSISGFSVLKESSERDELLTLDREFEDCRLILDNATEDTVSFRIKNIKPLNPNKPDKTQRIGCQFTAISPAFESGIQRYMQKIERENKMKS